MDHIVVVGASLAGLRACEQLRLGGFEGRVTLVGAEAHEPYDRPPLSKKLLAGDWDADRIRLRKPGELEELRIDARLGGGRHGTRSAASGGVARPVAARSPTTGSSSPPARRHAACPASPTRPASTCCARWTIRSACAPSWSPARGWW